MVLALTAIASTASARIFSPYMKFILPHSFLAKGSHTAQSRLVQVRALGRWGRVGGGFDRRWWGKINYLFNFPSSSVEKTPPLGPTTLICASRGWYCPSCWFWLWGLLCCHCPRTGAWFHITWRAANTQESCIHFSRGTHLRAMRQGIK